MKNIAITVTWEYKLQDQWIGWFWKKSTTGQRVDLWVILPPFGLPCLPIHISWTKR